MSANIGKPVVKAPSKMMWAAVRLNIEEGREWIDSTTLSADLEDCRCRSKVHGPGSGWEKVHPIQRFARVRIEEV